jgi:hypothetical protein
MNGVQSKMRISKPLAQLGDAFKTWLDARVKGHREQFVEYRLNVHRGIT